MIKSFLARVNGTGNNQSGRLYRITPGEGPDDESIVVDCKDVRARFESQAIIGLSDSREAIVAESQVRDAIKSAYYNATSHESGRYPVGGTHLPDDFEIKVL